MYLTDKRQKIRLDIFSVYPFSSCYKIHR